jgi:hypothetical protein
VLSERERTGDHVRDLAGVHQLEHFPEEPFLLGGENRFLRSTYRQRFFITIWHPSLDVNFSTSVVDIAGWLHNL